MTDVVEFRPKVVDVPILRRNESLIVSLEKMLADARAGELMSVAVAMVRLDGSVATFFDQYEGDKYRLGTGVGLLHHRYIRTLLDE